MSGKKQTAVPPRRYSVAEIDRMREAVQRIERSSIERRICTLSGMIVKGEAAVIEDQLRTYMLGGVLPRSLEAKAEADLTRLARVMERAAAKRLARAQNRNLRRLFRLDPPLGPLVAGLQIYCVNDEINDFLHAAKEIEREDGRK